MKAFLSVTLFLAAMFCSFPQDVFSQTGTRTVTGFAFADSNGNGLYDGGEEIVCGVDAYLIDADGNVVASASSDENCKHSFPEVPHGVYTIMVQVDKNSFVQSIEFTVDGRGEEIVIPIPVNDDTLRFGPSPLLTAVQEFIQMASNPGNPKTDNPASGFTP